MRKPPRGVGPGGPAPRLRVLGVLVLTVWISACVTTALAIMHRDWLGIVNAGTAALCAAGWLIAVRWWAVWRMAALAAWAVIWPDPDELDET